MDLLHYVGYFDCLQTESLAWQEHLNLRETIQLRNNCKIVLGVLFSCSRIALLYNVLSHISVTFSLDPFVFYNNLTSLSSFSMGVMCMFLNNKKLTK